ncbi:MAG: TnpV protein [Lachnospiraceae bacterium]|nr:TnpV protein [Lachnospiraceae bacterium]
MADDGILYPNISFETENLAELGKYGLMALDYLKDNYYESNTNNYESTSICV